MDMMLYRIGANEGPVLWIRYCTELVLMKARSYEYDVLQNWC